ncbi:MAG: AIR synthase-related protein, partial [Sulfurovum sp.]|nr:AIR synthase-related protein [Sulfurovum sp.]
EACQALNTPVVSGNVSLYNETNGVSVFPTPAIAMVGLNDDQNRVLPSHFQNAGSHIVLVGETKGEFGGSLYIKELYGETVGKLPSFDYQTELKLWELVIEANKQNLLASAKDVNLGGVAIALSKMAAVGNHGVHADISVTDSRDIFDESQSRALLEVESVEKLDRLMEMVQKLGLKAEVIGTVGGDVVKVNEVVLPLDEVKDVYFHTFARTIEQDL